MMRLITGSPRDCVATNKMFELVKTVCARAMRRKLLYHNEIAIGFTGNDE